MKTAHYVKVVALMTSILFTCVQVGMAGNVYTVRVPEEAGTVVSRYKGDTKETVIIVQDAHTSAEAQKNISDIISHVTRTYDVQQVNIEGASGDIDFDFFQQYPHKDIVNSVSEKMMRKGIITGSEHAAIVNEKKLDVKGVENKEEYLKNYEACKYIFEKKEDSLRIIKNFEDVISQEKKRVF